MTASTFSRLERAADFPCPVSENVPLAPLTSLGVGGPARLMARCEDAGTVRALLIAAREQSLPTLAIGGGSNMLVSDEGFDGLVVQLSANDVEIEPLADGALVRAAAGVDWDALVERVVSEGLAGLECLSGIPGRVGAAPIQNVGAYGQEVAETLEAVYAIDRRTCEARRFTTRDCGFSYRHSHFKGVWRDRFLITAVDFRLPRRRVGTVRYPELRRRFGMEKTSASPPLAAVRDEVLALRRSKSMVLGNPRDPNRRSAGSFFLNPVVSTARAEAVRRQAAKTSDAPTPTFETRDGRAKLSAAWLIERAGFRRGARFGRVGLSSKHALVLINRGRATATELTALAARIRWAVREAFEVTLEPEPVFAGFPVPVAELLDNPPVDLQSMPLEESADDA